MVSITAQYNKKALKRLSLADIDTPPSNCRNKRKLPLERIAVSGVKRQNDVINSQFTCPKNMNSFQAVLFFLLTYPEITAFNRLKALSFCLSKQKKRTARKELLKGTAISGRVNRLNVAVVRPILKFVTTS